MKEFFESFINWLTQPAVLAIFILALIVILLGAYVLVIVALGKVSHLRKDYTNYVCDTTIKNESKKIDEIRHENSYCECDSCDHVENYNGDVEVEVPADTDVVVVSTPTEETVVVLEPEVTPEQINATEEEPVQEEPAPEAEPEEAPVEEPQPEPVEEPVDEKITEEPEYKVEGEEPEKPVKEEKVTRKYDKSGIMRFTFTQLKNIVLLLGGVGHWKNKSDVVKAIKLILAMQSCTIAQVTNVLRLNILNVSEDDIKNAKNKGELIALLKSALGGEK